MSRLERIVLGRGIFGTPSAPTNAGLFPFSDPGHVESTLSIDPIASALVPPGQACESWADGEGVKLPNA